MFLRDARFSFDVLAERARQTAYLVPGLGIAIHEEGPEPRQAEFRFDGGISEFCAHLTTGEPVTDVIRLTGSGNFTETIPVLDDRGHMTPTEVERELQVDVAVQWGSGYDTVVRSFVNVIATPHGGTHVAGFERALVRTLNEQLRAARLNKNGDVIKEDVLEGLVAVVSVRVPEPQFEGQTKEVLGTPAASRIVAQVVGAELRSYLEKPPRGASRKPRALLDKVMAAAQARIAAREHRDNQRRKSLLASSSLPAKLVDCRSADDRSELFIVEGDSALGTAKLARDSEFQALLPIRGKILNVQKASLADMLKNAECASIIQVIGAGSGSTFDLDSARYQRIIFMADADVDGAHIRTLLLTLFHRYLRPMLEAGRVFAAVPPLHRIELTSVRKGQDKYRYTYSDAELNRTLLDLERRGQRWKEPVQRYKGLGEMDAEQLAETTMDPRHRTLRRIRIEDAAAATEMFSLLMGTDVAPRRDFIVAAAAELDPVPHRRLSDATRPAPRGPAGATASRRYGTRAAPPITASWRRSAMPDPSRLPTGSGRMTGLPESVAPTAGAGPAQAMTSASSPLRNRWQRTPPVARPLAGNSCSGVTFTLPAVVPGSAPARPATVITTAGEYVPGGPDGDPEAAAASTAPNHTTEAPADSRTPAMPPAARPCGRTEDAGKRSSCASDVTNTSSSDSPDSWTAPTTRSPGRSAISSNSSRFCG